MTAQPGDKADTRERPVNSESVPSTLESLEKRIAKLEEILLARPVVYTDMRNTAGYYRQPPRINSLGEVLAKLRRSP